jgi:hypothetical protein
MKVTTTLAAMVPDSGATVTTTEAAR